MHSIKNYLCAISVLVITLSTSTRAQQFSGWSAPASLGSVVNSGCAPGVSPCNDMHPALSRDGLTLFFSSDRPGGCGGLDIYVTQRESADSPWEAPANLDAERLAQHLPCVVNSNLVDHAPNLSTDGHWLYFHSFRDGGCGGSDIYVAHRKQKRDDFAWEIPVNLNRIGHDPEASLICGVVGDLTLVNTPNSDAGPTYFQDEDGATILYFNRGDQPTNTGDFDIYWARLAPDGSWGPITRDNELSTTPYRDTRTAIRRRDGLEMIISSERPGGIGDSRDLWSATRNSTSEPWSIPLLLPNVNSATLDGGPAISWDGTELYFFSGRGGATAGNDLYVSTRTKITGPQPRP